MTAFLPVQARRLASGELELLGLGAPMIREELERLKRRVAELEGAYRPPLRIVGVEEVVPGSGSPADLYNRADPSCEGCHGFGYRMRATGDGPTDVLERRPCACLRSVEEVYGS